MQQLPRNLTHQERGLRMRDAIDILERQLRVRIPGDAEDDAVAARTAAEMLWPVAGEWRHAQLNSALGALVASVDAVGENRGSHDLLGWTMEFVFPVIRAWEALRSPGGVD